MSIRYLALSAAALALTACQNASQKVEPSSGEATVSYLTENPGPGKLTPEILGSDVALSGTGLRKAQISPDGSMVTVLQGREDNARQQDLWAYDLETGEGRLLVSSTDLLGEPVELSDEEKNRRERAREYANGIVDYSWAGDSQLLFPLGGDIYVYDLEARQAQQVTATKGFETDAKVSESGRFVAYVRENNLYVTDLSSGLERQLTDGATDLIRNATASFVVQEELDRKTGYWWSPDESRLAYTRIDESPIAIESRIEFGADGIRNISQRYPFAGTENATVNLGIVDRSGGETVWVDLGADTDIYLTRVLWSADGQTLYVGLLSRDHKTHTFLKVDPNSGQFGSFFKDTSPTWLNIGTDLKSLENGDMLWSSERHDKRQLFKISEAGAAMAITPETIMVNDLNCVDEEAGQIYFTGWDDTALRRDIFRVGLDGEGLTKISSGEGRHSAKFSENCSRYIGTFSNPTTPYQTRAFENDGSPLTWLSENALNADHPYAPYLDAHIAPEFGQIEAEDGTLLDYVIYKPKDLKPGQKRASITMVYGGPGVQRVHLGWQRLSAQMYAAHGFVVFQIDGRGATNRGKAFEDHLYRSMGRAEVVDQAAGANWLKAQDFIDPDRMGVMGWSYGGYMALHMLAQTDLYQSGVSGAPVTDWALYDTAYTERYLGHPDPSDTNYTTGAYENGSVFPYLDGLSEPFLLIHGMADDNVVFRHTIKLMDAMQDRGAQNMRLMTYPGEKHGFRKSENRVHRDRMSLAFFLETLGE